MGFWDQCQAVSPQVSFVLLEASKVMCEAFKHSSPESLWGVES